MTAPAPAKYPGSGRLWLRNPADTCSFIVDLHTVLYITLVFRILVSNPDQTISMYGTLYCNKKLRHCTRILIQFEFISATIFNHHNQDIENISIARAYID